MSVDRDGLLTSVAWSAMVTTAAEPARYRRGRQYLREDAVLSLEVRSGRISGDVQGSRPLPYHVAVRVSLLGETSGLGPAQLTPAPDEVDWECDCPDWESPCKHAVAVALAFGERLRLAPGALAELRGGDSPPAAQPAAEPAPAQVAGRRHLTLVHSSSRRAADASAGLTPEVAAFLGDQPPVEGEATLGELPPPEIPALRVGVVDLTAFVGDAHAWLAGAFPRHDPPPRR